MSTQSTSLSAAVVATGVPTPLIDKVSGRPVSHAIYSCSDTQICDDSEDIHPSIVAMFPKGTRVDVSDPVGEIMDFAPFDTMDENTEGVVLIERAPLALFSARATLASGVLEALVDPLGVEEFNCFVVHEFACSATGDGIVVDVDVRAPYASVDVVDGVRVFTAFDELRRPVLRVAAKSMDPDVGVVISSNERDGRTSVMLWTEFVD